MKASYIPILLLFSSLVYPQTDLGFDSGYKSIILYENNKETEDAVLILGGIHGDEQGTVEVVNYIKEKLTSNLTIYYIPETNPTLSNTDVLRRGYLADHLNSSGYLLKTSNPKDFNKTLYYRIFYGNNATYSNNIKYYIDPNRDFLDKKLPSTRILIETIENLSNRHKLLIIISFHGYMTGGKVYPEYIVSNDDIIVKGRIWTLVNTFASASGFTPELIYSPAIAILERFRGELIAYTSTLENVYAMDVELDADNRAENRNRSLKGIEAIIEYLDK